MDGPSSLVHSPEPFRETSVDLVTLVEEFFEEELPKVEGFQVRESQKEMALAVAQSIQDKSHLAVEAGTGTGKSLAYLVPLLLSESEEDSPHIISTKTVQLQEQLLKKDLPLLQRLLPTPKKFVQAKGWSNYLCIRKLETPDEQTIRLMGPQLNDLHRQVLNNSGKLTRQQAVISREHWDRVKADPLDCQKRHCPHFARCGLFSERRELESADVIVTNHAFLLTDLRLRREGTGLLPEGQVLVIDEAHRLDDVATEHLAVRFDQDRVFSTISSPLLSGADGWLAATRFTFLMTLPEQDFKAWSDRFDLVIFANLKNLETAATLIFMEIQGLLIAERSRRSDLEEVLHSVDGEHLANLCAEMCLALEENSKALDLMCREYEECFQHSPPPELIRLSHSLARLGQDLNFLLQTESTDWVYLLELEQQAMVARPIDNSQALEAELFGDYHSVITTSASLQVNKSFHFFRSRIGMRDNVKECSFASPFSFSQNTFVGFCSEGCEPSAENYAQSLQEGLLDLITSLQGRTLLLTTSHRRVREFTQLLRPGLAEFSVEVLSQGEQSAPQLLKRFHSSGRFLLVGVDTFWEGVDIPGERLSCVVMTRLPFPVPSDVLFKARAQKVESEGGHSFGDLSIPLVTLKLKQGFGRLLRTESDKGIFLLTDPRICTKRYGRRLVHNLPCEHAHKASFYDLVGEAISWSSEHLET